MNIHDYATRQAAIDRATGKGTVAVPLETVIADMREQAAGNPELLAAIDAAETAIMEDSQ